MHFLNIKEHSAAMDEIISKGDDTVNPHLLDPYTMDFGSNGWAGLL